jgi:mRNA interferase RelE/StbE
VEKYSIEILPKAEKEFLKLPDNFKNLIKKAILQLENNPRPFGVKKLRETEYYRIRVGDYRVLYSISDRNRLIKILSIAHRKEVYKGI